MLLHLMKAGIAPSQHGFLKLCISKLIAKEFDEIRGRAHILVHDGALLMGALLSWL